MRITSLCALLAAACALDNGLGLTPRLAFSTWNFFGTSANETHVHEIAAALERTGLKDLGFDTVNIDAGSVDRDQSTGKLVASRRFPSGMKALSGFLHGAGFKFGAYNDISGHTCGNGPAAGSLNHYSVDAETFAHDWQVDYLKFDFCGVQLPGTPPENCTGVVGRSCGTLPVESAKQYAHWSALSVAINKTGRPIYLDFCPHAIADGVGTEVPKGKLMYAPPKDWSLAQRRALSNSLLVEFDNTWDSWNWKNSSGLIFNIDAMIRATNLSYSGPGAWNYGDMLQLCAYGKGVTPGSGMTLSEYRTHYSVYSILASPLVIGADVRTIDKDHPDCLALLKNKAIVHVNQDSAALPPRLVSQTPPYGSAEAHTLNVTVQIFARPLSRGRLAVLLLNRGAATTHLAASWSELGIAADQKVSVYDVTTESSRGSAVGSFQADVPSHDVAFVVLQPEPGALPLHPL
jgi:alpha-galactosidase